MRTNEQRAENGRDLAAIALTNTLRMTREDFDSGLVDALANLMHFARRYDLNFEAALSMARTHHAAERRHAWEEVPD